MNNWQVFDAVTDPDTDASGPKGAGADGFISSTGTNARFVGTGFLQSDQTSSSEDANGVDAFLAGQQAYVFIRSGDTPTPGTEWLLYTSTSGEVWEYPAVSGGQQSTPLSWFAGEADSAIWGAVNGGNGPNGERTDLSTDFVLRTHTFVPEPSSALLLFLGSVFLVRRKRAQS